MKWIGLQQINFTNTNGGEKTDLLRLLNQKGRSYILNHKKQKVLQNGFWI